MPNPNFPGPSINRILDSSPKIVRVPLETTDWGARKANLPKDVKNSMTIRHVGDKA